MAFSRDTNIADGTTQTFRIVDGSSNVYWGGIQLSRSGDVVTGVAGIG